MEVRKWPDTASWEQVVQKSPEATFYHTPKWHTFFLAAYKKYSIGTREFIFGDGPKAIFPCFQVKAGSFFRRNLRIKSSYFGGYGGVVSTEKLSAPQEGKIHKYISEEFDTVSITGNPFSENRLPESFVSENDFAQVVLLEGGGDLCLRNFSRGAKSNLNQAKKRGVTVRTTKNKGDVSVYYAMYQDTLKRWGDRTIIVFPEAIFHKIFENIGEHIKVWVAELDNKIIAAAIIFYWNNVVNFWHGVSLQDYFNCYPNNMLHAEVMREASSEGFKYYDFGPSGGLEGLIKFKQSFGAKKRPFVAAHWKKRWSKK